MPDEPTRWRSRLSTLGWACYLACSWTWCIGMFLPVLLIRDYGIWGFVVFAVPNVVGAAAMGWVLRRPGSSEELQNAHRAAIGWFSTITGAFQFYFVWWLQMSSTNASAGYLLELFAVFGVLMLVIFGAIGRAGGFPRALSDVSCILVWLMSVAVAVILFKGLRLPSAEAGRDANPQLLAIAAVCGFGFLLCPYLDRTLHHTRQNLDSKSSRVVFLVGFGIMFFALILFALGYAHWFMPTGDPVRGLRAMGTWGAVLAVYMGMQLGFTGLAHAALAIPSLKYRNSPVKRWVVYPHLVVVMVVPNAARVVAEFVPQYHGLSTMEVTYRLFMAFYGLIFPAYVWLCMIPTWRAPRSPMRREIAVWVGACALAAPAYWMGFIERREWWLVPGLAVVLLARLLVRGGPGPDGRSGAPVPAPSRPPQGTARAEAGG